MSATTPSCAALPAVAHDVAPGADSAAHLSPRTCISLGTPPVMLTAANSCAASPIAVLAIQQPAFALPHEALCSPAQSSSGSNSSSSALTPALAPAFALASAPAFVPAPALAPVPAPATADAEPVFVSCVRSVGQPRRFTPPSQALEATWHASGRKATQLSNESPASSSSCS